MKKGRFIFFPLMFIAAVLGLGLAVMYLWNSILPAVTPLGVLTYWQAVGLLILCRILFGGFGKGRGWNVGPREHMKQKFMNMNTEEREQFKEEWRKRCGKD